MLIHASRAKRTKQALAQRKPKERKTAKALLNMGELLPEVRKEELDAKSPIRLCYVCDRPSRNLQMITATKYRHTDCEVGSPNWLDYWERLPDNHPAKANGKFIYDQHRSLKCEK